MKHEVKLDLTLKKNEEKAWKFMMVLVGQYQKHLKML